MILTFMVTTGEALLWIMLGVILLYGGIKVLVGYRRFPRYRSLLAEEGLLRSERWVPVRFSFPMIKRITLAHVYLSPKRLLLFHFLTRGLMLQVPLGPAGKAGNEEGRFEVEGVKEVLTIHAAMRGGGRIRIHVKSGKEWLRDIVEKGT